VYDVEALLAAGVLLISFHLILMSHFPVSTVSKKW